MSEAQFKKQAMDKLGIKVTKKTNKAQVAQNLALALGTQAIEGLTQEQQSAYAATLFGKEAMSGMLAIINASEDDYKNCRSYCQFRGRGKGHGRNNAGQPQRTADHP